MSKSSKIGVLGASALLLAALAIPALAASEVTVGRFIQELAKTKNLNATDAGTAADSLRAVGVRLPADLDLRKQLTQGDVTEISRHVGLRVTTTEPGSAFSEDQLDRFFLSFGSELGGEGDCAVPGGDCENPGQGSGPGNGQGGPPFDPFTKAKGKGRGKAKFTRSPSAAD